VGTWRHLSGTKAMASSSHGKLLKRRIEMILAKQKIQPWPGRVIALGTFLIMASVAFATHGVIQDRRVTRAEAEAWRAKAQPNSEIPLAVNELVLRELNYYVGTPEGRQQFKNGLTRLPMYKKMIDERLEEYRFPKELIVVPLLESGFDNNAASKVSKGIWQFVAQTARRYGLRVDQTVDERLDEGKETVAGMQYFRDLMLLFSDWRFALKAYNEGEYRVMNLIKKYGTRDPWEIEFKEEGRDRYLAKMTAGIIILQNLAILD
jgi:membrane-bound lytic murein transglycosylase D